MSDRWFFRQRQEWIAQMLRVYGFINREHLQKKFEISTPQASVDLQYFQKCNDGVMVYSSARKRYEAADEQAEVSHGVSHDVAAPSCGSCHFFRAGQCRLAPPARLPRRFDASATSGNRVRDEDLIWGWPSVEAAEWCGQWSTAEQLTKSHRPEDGK